MHSKHIPDTTQNGVGDIAFYCHNASFTAVFYCAAVIFLKKSNFCVLDIKGCTMWYRFCASGFVCGFY